MSQQTGLKFPSKKPSQDSIKELREMIEFRDGQIEELIKVKENYWKLYSESQGLVENLKSRLESCEETVQCLRNDLAYVRQQCNTLRKMVSVV